MSKTREALEAALATLEDVFGKHKVDVGVINQLRDVLAEPEQSPIVGSKTWFEDGKMVTQYLTEADVYKEPASREPMPLAKAEEFAHVTAWDYKHAQGGRPNFYIFDANTLEQLIRKVERFHGIGE